MSLSAHRLCRLVAVLLFILLTASLVSEAAVEEAVTSAEDAATVSRDAFARLAEVYRSGGSAPDLVAKLNAALELIDEAQVRRAKGDESQAVLLEERARTIIAEIVNEVPAAQQRAERDATTRVLLVSVTVPVVVAISTLLFYVVLRSWRWYEKTKLFEMEIVEKKKEEA